MKSHIFTQIIGCSEESAHGSEGSVGQWRFRKIAAVRLQAIPGGARGGRNLRKLEGRIVHLELPQNLSLNIFFVRHPRSLRNDATQKPEGVVRILVARARGGGERDAFLQPLRKIGVGGCQLLVAPWVVFRETGGMAHDIADT